MTDKTNTPAPAHEAVLTDEEILQVFSDVVGNQEDDARFIDVDRDQAIRIARALLSKLRAPVAGEAQPVAWGTTDGREPISDELKRAHSRYATAYTVPLYAAPQASKAVRDSGIAASDDVMLPPLPEALALQPGQLGYTGQTLDCFARAAVLADRQQRAALSAQPSGNSGELSAQPGAQKGGRDA